MHPVETFLRIPAPLPTHRLAGGHSLTSGFVLVNHTAQLIATRTPASTDWVPNCRALPPLPSGGPLTCSGHCALPRGARHVDFRRFHFDQWIQVICLDIWGRHLATLLPLWQVLLASEKWKVLPWLSGSVG